jgi:hypothetical protein
LFNAKETDTSATTAVGCAQLQEIVGWDKK